MIFSSKRPQAPTRGSVILLQVPRTNEKKELAAEQMFASLHGLLITAEKKRFGQEAIHHERISFEIAVQAKRIGFYVWVPEELKSFVEEQIYAQYPTVHISEVPDYTLTDRPAVTELTSELKLMNSDVLPIKTFPSFEVDPLAAITATLAQFEENEEAWIQFVVKPAPEKWHLKSEKFISGLRGGGSSSSGLLAALWKPPEKTAIAAPKLVEHETARIAGAETKSQKLAYEVTLRIVYRGNGTSSAGKMRMQAIIASFKQFNTTYLNGFTQAYMSPEPSAITAFRDRAFKKHGFVCNIEEVASLYHLPHTNVETPNILWATSQTAEPPANLPLVEGPYKPEELSPIAITNFRGHNTMFGMPRSDRGRHLYIIGQTGVGKSGMLELLTISDLHSPYGFAIIDPHGDYALNILRRIPAERANDVIYFNPADTDFPIAFNPMEVNDPKLKTHVTSELIGVLKRMFESWGPRLEYILRYSLLALLEYPDATMLDITRILTDKKFRMEVLQYVGDPVVRNFWLIEFASWNDKFAAEAVAPVLNKVGAFTANPIVRNIIGQPKSSFNIREIMDNRKILIVNLSRGLIGEDNASLLGALLVTKIQMAAMSRADIPHIEDRIPFYLYVDEFQNFATDSFSVILSEARKYGLNLTVANQYIAQMSMSVKDAVFGNVGSIISFRMSADDSRTMLKYYEPKFTDYDLVHMHNRNFVISMTINGEKAQAFSAFSLNLPASPTDFSAEIINQSRQQYSVNRQHIEDFVQERYVGTEKAVAEVHKKAAAPARDPSPVRQKTRTDQTIPKTVEEVALKSMVEKPQAVAEPSEHPHIPGSTDPAKPKRKRTRRRKNKGEVNEPSVREAAAQPNNVRPVVHAQPQPPAASSDGETVIHLR